MKRVLIKSCNLIGDGLYVGPVAKKWYDTEGKDFDEIYLETINNHATAIYEGMGIPWNIMIGPKAEGPFDRVLDFDVSKAFEISDKKKCHLVHSYAELVGVDPIGIPLVPNYQPPDIDVSEEKKGLALISMFSMSCMSRENPPRPPNKMLPWEKWGPVMRTLWDEYGENKVKLIGGKSDIIPIEEATKIGILWPNDYMVGVPIPEQAAIMKHAKCLVTVDNGMGHLAASVGCPEFLLVPAALAMHFIIPWGHKGLRTIHIDPVTINPEEINQHLKSAIKDWKA